jgi:pyruvate,orthophosphate dikinase
MQDFEFTVENSQLFLLQCRNGKRSARATARIALDLLDAGWISRSQALERTAGLDRDSLALPHVVAENAVAGESAPVPQLLPLAPLGQAVSANSGVATGALALDQAHAEASHARGESVILVRRDAETSDIAALDLSVGLLTQRGARTSHAAVVARQLGKVCLVGCDALRIDEAARTITLGDTTLPEGALLTLDGNQGLFYAGATRTVLDFPEDLLARLALLRQGEAALITGA